MRTFSLSFLFFISTILSRGQESPAKSEMIVVLPPMVISGSFELQKRSSIAELVIKDVEHQFDEKQKAAEKATAGAAFWQARFWEYIPLRLAPTDDQQFFTPSYLTLANQHSLRALELSQKNPLFDSLPGE